MFVSRVKSKGITYIYAYIYDNTSMNKMRTVYSLGNKEKALRELAQWEEKSEIPNTLLENGFSRGMIGEWKQKIEKL